MLPIRTSVIQNATHFRAGLDLSNGSLVKLARIRLPVLDAELLLNTSGVAPGEAALVDVGGPVQVSFGGSSIDTRLESDDKLPGDDIVLLGDGSGSRKDTGEQGSEEYSEVANVDHVEVCGA
jgi:hypothetical protein